MITKKDPSSGDLDMSCLTQGNYEALTTCSGCDDYYASISMLSNQVEILDTVLSPASEVQYTLS